MKFKSDRSKHPISIKASFGENEDHKSKQYARNENIHWIIEKYVLVAGTLYRDVTDFASPVRQFACESRFTISVRQHSRTRRTVSIMTVSVSVSELITRPFFETASRS